MKLIDSKVKLYNHSHTSADSRSGDIGDIQINNEEGFPYEAVEVKYERLIDHVLVEDIFEKIKPYPVDRYYILSTKVTTGEELVKINETITSIANSHGCQVIVNGLIPTLKYYLRLLGNTDVFISNYTQLVLNDLAVKAEHKRLWKQIIEG